MGGGGGETMKVNKQLLLPLLLDTSKFWGGQYRDLDGNGYGYGGGYGYGYGNVYGCGDGYGDGDGGSNINE